MVLLSLSGPHSLEHRYRIAAAVWRVISFGLLHLSDKLKGRLIPFEHFDGFEYGVEYG